MKAGRLRRRCEFQRSVPMVSPIGESMNGWTTAIERWGDLKLEFGSESVKAGRLESEVPGVLTIRWSQAAAEIDASWRVVVDGTPYQVRSVSDPDQRRRSLDFVVQSGVATADAPNPS